MILNTNIFFVFQKRARTVGFSRYGSVIETILAAGFELWDQLFHLHVGL